MASNDGRAVASLVCGILCWFTCPVILAIAAIMLGSGNPSGMATAGRVLGWLNIVVSIGALLLWLLMAALGLGFGGFF